MSPTTIREKETFRTEMLVDDVKLYVKCSVNYERLTYKVQPVLTLVHEFGPEIQEALVEACQASRDECLSRLDKYRDEAGIGRQTSLNFEDEPQAAAA